MADKEDLKRRATDLGARRQSLQEHFRQKRYQLSLEQERAVRELDEEERRLVREWWSEEAPCPKP